MILAKVIGNVVATRKEPSLEGTKLMIVRRVDVDGAYIDQEEVAVDYVGCGIGELFYVRQVLLFVLTMTNMTRQLIWL